MLSRRLTRCRDCRAASPGGELKHSRSQVRLWDRVSLGAAKLVGDTLTVLFGPRWLRQATRRATGINQDLVLLCRLHLRRYSRCCIDNGALIVGNDDAQVVVCAAIRPSLKSSRSS